MLKGLKHSKGDLEYLGNEVSMLCMVLESTANDMEQISYLSPEESSLSVWYLTLALESYRKVVVSVEALVHKLENHRPSDANPNVKARLKFVRAQETIEKYRERIKNHVHFLCFQQQDFHE